MLLSKRRKNAITRYDAVFNKEKGQKMNSVVIYDSTFGNTEQIARVIAGRLGEHGTVKLMRSDEAASLNLKEMDLLVIGCPIHRQRMTPAIGALLANIPRRSLKGRAAAAFDTRYQLNWFLSNFTAAQEIASKLKRTGASLIVPPEGFIVTGREGPLQEGELARAAQWAERIVEQFETASSLHKEKAGVR
jgi:flavodoxin I